MYHEPSFEPVRQEMMQLLKKHIRCTEKKELVSLTEADGRIAAEDICAPYSMPNRRTSGCDGIAVRFSDFAKGMPDTSSWKKGNEYVYSNTGVAIPDQYDTVLPIEEVVLSETGSLSLRSVPPEQGSEVNPIGSQILEGELILAKGEEIRPDTIGLLASAGFTCVSVMARPKVTFIPTGDELVPSGFPVPAGKNVESNSLMVCAYLKRFGANAVSMPVIPDDPDAIRNALTTAITASDLVIIGAGSSKGTKDYTMDVLETLGTVIVQELGVAPGKHCGLTMAGHIPVLGIPGPPGGARLITRYYAKAAVDLLYTGQILPPESVSAILDEDVSPKWIDFMQPVSLYEKDGILYAHPEKSFGLTLAQSLRCSHSYFYCQKKNAYQKGLRILAETPI